MGRALVHGAVDYALILAVDVSPFPALQLADGFAGFAIKIKILTLNL